ncbi:MAG: hypothetical protein ACF8MJ_10140 [Phycisphaerales bacterium JB050]
MSATRHEPEPRDGRRPSRLARVLWACSSVRLGLLLFVGVALYSALGTVPLGPLFEMLGGRAEAPEPTLRHLPWVDLRESEYYSTLLFSVLLGLIVVNMALATLLRIRWERRKAGVIITHVGVIVLAAGALVATRDPLNATMALFADQPTSSGLDRTRTLLSWDPDLLTESSERVWRLDGVLSRYADFGVPWVDEEREIQLDGEVRITGYAHSARLVSRIETGPEGSPAGWQLMEQRRTGEARVISLLADGSDHSVGTLSDGTRVAVFNHRLFRGDDSAITQVRETEGGFVLLYPTASDEVMVLPAHRGATATLTTPNGVWTAEFLDRVGVEGGPAIANLRLSGPGFPSTMLYAAAWDPAHRGLYTEAPEGGIALVDLPVGMSMLFCDARMDAVLITSDGWLRSHRAGSIDVGSARLVEGDEIALNDTTTLTVDRMFDQAAMTTAVERVPFAEDAQLLADPRLGSMIRVTDSTREHDPGRWIVFDEQAEASSGTGGFAYTAAPFTITDATVTFRGFDAKLFRRGSVPRDFLVELDITNGDGVHSHTLSLNHPVRATLDIDGRPRHVQLSLIGWDSEGWESHRPDADDRFEGARFVVVSITQREGVGLSIAGGGLILLGAGISVLGRMIRRTPRAEGAA